MREILFRGKTNGNWVYGNLVYSNNLQTAIYFKVGKGSVKSFDWAYVTSETVGQFTGLNDKNGVKVFENDIVDLYFSEDYSDENHSFDAGERFDCVVTFKNGAFWCECKGTGYDYLFDTDIFYEVVGNIHDNKNLLEQNND